MSAGMKCSKCGSFNVSLNMSTGKAECHESNCNTIERPKQFNLDEYKNDSIEKEETNLNNMKVMGTDIKIEQKMKDAEELNKDQNNFSSLGL
jgi:hypothetical protein